MRKNVFLILAGGALLLLALLSSVFFLLQRNKQSLLHIYDSVVLDNVNHYLSCDQLPSKEEANRIIVQHREVVEKIIKDVSLYHQPTKEPQVIWDEKDRVVYNGDPMKGYSISVGWGNALECDGIDRAELFIPYGTHADRIIIQHIINSSTFFGIPYRLRNT